MVILSHVALDMLKAPMYPAIHSQYIVKGIFPFSLNLPKTPCSTAPIALERWFLKTAASIWPGKTLPDTKIPTDQLIGHISFKKPLIWDLTLFLDTVIFKKRRKWDRWWLVIDDHPVHRNSQILFSTPRGPLILDLVLFVEFEFSIIRILFIRRNKCTAITPSIFSWWYLLSLLVQDPIYLPRRH